MIRVKGEPIREHTKHGRMDERLGMLPNGVYLYGQRRADELKKFDAIWLTVLVY